MSNKVINRIQNAKKQLELNENALAVDYSQEKDLLDEFLENFDIRDIPSDVLDRQYVEYYIFYITEALCFPSNSLWDEMKEALNYVDVSQISNPIYPIIEELNTRYKFDDWQIYCYIDNEFGVDNVKSVVKFPKKPIEEIVLIVADIGKNVAVVNTVLRQNGYYIARMVNDNVDGRQWIYILFNPITQDSFNNYIVEHSKYLYHTTIASNDERIMQIGFAPSTRERPDMQLSYTNRGFFKLDEKFPRKGRVLMTNMLKRFSDDYIKINPSRKFYTYILDAKAACNYCIFYRDPNAYESCYTNDYVSPDFIIEKRLEIIDDKYIFNFKD